MLFADEASFRQDPTLYQTWARRGCQPLVLTTGQRNTQKVFGAVDIRRPRVEFVVGEVMFSGQTYTAFLNSLARRYCRQEVFLVQDNAPYHDGPEVKAWLGEYGHRFHLVSLPKYSPESQRRRTHLALRAGECNPQSVFSQQTGIRRHVEWEIKGHRGTPGPDRRLHEALSLILYVPLLMRGYVAPRCILSAPLRSLPAWESQ